MSLHISPGISRLESKHNIHKATKSTDTVHGQNTKKTISYRVREGRRCSEQMEQQTSLEQSSKQQAAHTIEMTFHLHRTPNMPFSLNNTPVQQCAAERLSHTFEVHSKIQQLGRNNLSTLSMTPVNLQPVHPDFRLSDSRTGLSQKIEQIL